MRILVTSPVFYCSHFIFFRRYTICCNKRPQIFHPVGVIRCRTLPRYLRCSSKVLPITIMLSRYTRQTFEYSPLSTRSISRSNVCVQSPNCITLNCHKPPFALNAFFFLSLYAISTYQYTACRSNVENHFLPASVSNVSSILASG